MTDLVKVEVLRAIGGFAVGAEREVTPADAKRLEARGHVRILQSKAEPAVKNKMAAAPSNKAAK